MDNIYVICLTICNYCPSYPLQVALSKLQADAANRPFKIEKKEKGEEAGEEREKRRKRGHVRRKCVFFCVLACFHDPMAVKESMTHSRRTCVISSRSDQSKQS